MLRRSMTHQFEKVEGSDKVGVDIGARIVEAVSHPRLRGEVINGVEAGAIDFAQGREVFEQRVMAAKARVLLQNRGAAPLEVGIVIGGEAVDSNDLVPIVEQPGGGMKTNEAG